MSLSEILFIASIAFLSSFTHCVGMCGGIVLAYSSKLNNELSFLKISSYHLIYNLGRTLTYILFGFLLGFISYYISFNMVAKGVLFLLIGVIIIIIGISQLKEIAILNSIKFKIIEISFLQKIIKKLLKNNSLLNLFILGILNGLIPCGLVYSFLIIALGTGSPILGAIVMGIFGLSTIPIMFTIGIISTTLLQDKIKLKKYIIKVSAILLISYGIFSLFKAFMFIQNPEIINNKIQNISMEINK